MLNPFHPVYEFTNPNLFAIALDFAKMASPSARVKTSLPKMSIGSLAFLISSQS